MKISNVVKTICGVALAITIIWSVIVASNNRSIDIINAWAYTNNYKVIKTDMSFWPGPFWYKNKSQTVYRLTLEDKNKVRRTAWALCGNYWLGIYVSNDIKVEFD